MVLIDYVVNLVIAVILIVGGYQFYFFPQKRALRSAKEFYLSLDSKIPFRPSWVWVYSGLYYPAILLLVFTSNSFKEFNHIAFSFIVLLILQLSIFFLYPVKTPSSWRDFDSQSSFSTRFLSFVHRFDAQSNCFPSMHVSVATLTSFHLMEHYSHLYAEWSLVVFLFPALIAMSTLYTKQHYFVDIPAGIVLGYLVYALLSTI